MPKLTQVIPNALRGTLRAIVPTLAAKRHGPVLPSYASEDLIERLMVPVTDENPDAEAALEFSDHCAKLIDDHNWIDLARLLADLDQSRTTVPSGRRMLELVTSDIRDSLAELYEAPNAVNYQTSFMFSTSHLDAIEAAHLDNPENYMLAALLAQMHLDCAWSVRGSKAMDAIDRPTALLLRDHLKIVGDVVTRFDPIAHNSPYLAEIQYSYVALKDPNLMRLMCAFDDWVELDPANPTPYQHHAFFAHNLFGDDDDQIVDAEARRAVELGSDILGNGGYTAMYLQWLSKDEIAFRTLDVEKFIAGFEDYIVTLGRDPLRMTYMLEQLVMYLPVRDTDDMSRMARAKAAEIRVAVLPVIRQYVSVLYTSAWDLDEVEFLHAIAPAFDEELSRGATVEITEGGTLITEAVTNSK